jgi:hypothetical protein
MLGNVSSKRQRAACPFRCDVWVERRYVGWCHPVCEKSGDKVIRHPRAVDNRVPAADCRVDTYTRRGLEQRYDSPPVRSCEAIEDVDHFGDHMLSGMRGQRNSFMF